MPKRTDIETILVIGSGPIVIGQAAEFDYSGTQACQALREEGYHVILVNSNPATIMTDTATADKVYIEPLTLDFVTSIIRRERPDAILPTLGGQTALNLAVQLAQSGVLKEYGVEILGTKLAAIEQAEDRSLFRNLMQELNEPVPSSAIATTIDEALNIAEEIGYPLIVRPAYTLGGTGGGVCHSEIELRDIVSNGLKLSPVSQCLIERSIAGFKEIEYEVMRDAQDNAIVVCNMENIDPVGVHTGDSIVVAPSQTLSDREYHLLRNASLKIIRALKIEGGCNVQFGLDPKSYQYYVIEVNPRVSRSSALASKATGYPIARIAAKIAVGYSLAELTNPVTGQSSACFEPALDYVVAKIPRWPFDKFVFGNRVLGTQMKATGEVMAIGRNLEESLLKAVRSLELGVHHLTLSTAKNLTLDDLQRRITQPDDERLFLIAEAVRRGVSLEDIKAWSAIDSFFLKSIQRIVELEGELTKHPKNAEILREAKIRGFADSQIALQWNCSEEEVLELRRSLNLKPVFKTVDTCAAEFDANTPYFYSTYGTENESYVTKKESVLVLGSGPIRIGQGIEFDYATVHCVKAIQEAGFEAIIINNNPETVSTDYSISDKLYFEPLTVEDVMHVVEHEQPLGVIVQFGGQTALNLAEKLHNRGVRILGTSLEALDRAEDRHKFEKAMWELGIPQPPGKTATTLEKAVTTGDSVGYPLLVRPSYVLGGRAMRIVRNREALAEYLVKAKLVQDGQPVLLDRYIQGVEVEVDAISDGTDVYVAGIMEHIERAGIHSGDSIAVYPPQTLSKAIKEKIIDYTIRLGRGLNIVGLLNIQFVVNEDDVYVLEVNPRSSRTVPFLSKVTHLPLAVIATKVLLGLPLRSMRLSSGYHPESDEISVKVPVFSFAKLRAVDTLLGPEMKSTGEAMGKDRTLEKALFKGLLASGTQIPTHGSVIITVADANKEEAVEVARRFHEIGFNIFATSGTADYLMRNQIPVTKVSKIGEASESLLDIIRQGKAHFVINTSTEGEQAARDGFFIRREAVEHGIPCLTSLDTANAILRVLEALSFRPVPLGSSPKKVSRVQTERVEREIPCNA